VIFEERTTSDRGKNRAIVRPMRPWLVIAIFILLTTRLGMAVCSRPQPRMVCAEYFAKSVVLIATLEKTDILRSPDDPEGVEAFLYTLHADRALHGEISPNFQVRDENTSSRSTFDWIEGKKYLLFLSYSQGEHAWWLDGCGNSGPLDRSQSVLARIRHIKADHSNTGVIEGTVGTEQETTTPGAKVTATGKQGRFTARINFDGRFRMRVPTGRYEVRVSDPEYSFGGNLFSYEDPTGVQIESGGCAQLQFSISETK
jgi:hypothetical protein